MSYFNSIQRSSVNSVTALKRKRTPSGTNPYFEKQLSSLGTNDHFQNFYKNSQNLRIVRRISNNEPSDLVRASKLNISDQSQGPQKMGPITLQDIHKITEHNRKITHNITNSNLSITSEDQYQMQSKAQI